MGCQRQSSDAAATTLIGVDPAPESRFSKMLELTTLSGGRFAAGRIVLRVYWTV